MSFISNSKIIAQSNVRKEILVEIWWFYEQKLLIIQSIMHLMALNTKQQTELFWYLVVNFGTKY